MPEPSQLVVEALFRYPVKSMQGESVEALSFEGGHAAGDRQWALVDAESGFTLSAKRHGALLEAYARTTEDGSVVVALPGGGEHLVGEPDTDDAISTWLGRRIELHHAGSGALPIELLVDPLDDDSEVIALPIPEDHFADLADVHLLTTSSLRAATQLYPEGDWDVRRFRPTAMIAGAADGFVEDAWVGSHALLGDEVSVEVFMPTIRCSLPPRSQPGIERDTTIARTLRDNHDFSLGVYAAGRRDGTVRAGDVVTLRDGPA